MAISHGRRAPLSRRRGRRSGCRLGDGRRVGRRDAACGVRPLEHRRRLLGPPASSTHSIDFRRGVVTLGADAALDRDIVVRWVVPRQAPGVAIRTARPPAAGPVPGDASYGLITIVPPESGAPTLARDLVLLLDVSGSMSGRSIQQLKAVVAALIDSLSDRDRLEMIAFSSNQVRYGKGPVQTTDTERRKAHAWVAWLAAGGGTELIPAIGAALAPLRTGVPRQVVVMTDGLIGFESAAIRSIRDRLPRESRLHAIGIGSTPNRAFLGPAARAGRGVEILIDADEAAVCGAERIVAATRDPVVVDVVVDGTALVDAAPRIPDLLAGSPVRSAVRLRPSGGTLVVRGRMAGGYWEHRLDVPPTAAGEGSAAISSLWAREAIEDLELDLACAGDRTDIDRRIEEIAVRHSIASRLTSWVAVAEGPGVDPREPVRVERIPQALPYGMSVEGLGLVSFGTMARTGQPAGIRLPSLLGMPRRLGGLGEIEGSFHDLSRASEGSTVERREFEPRVHALLDRFVRAAVGLRKAASRVDTLSHQLRERLLAVLREHRREMEAGAVELRGRVFPTPGRPTATIQVAVTCELEWRPAQTATLGRSRIAVVDRGTTRPGPVMAGTTVRVELAASPDEVARAGTFVIACGGHQLTVALDKSE